MVFGVDDHLDDPQRSDLAHDRVADDIPAVPLGRSFPRDADLDLIAIVQLLGVAEAH